ncbi:MAG: DNA ligase, partial [Bacteroidota bacterium]|nr:DNA ligase [Bacteroidota bacterium]
MGLVKYKAKRNFKESPEPTGGKSDSEKLRFVIQKHHASHLHYDFRLEMEGVLKSWAVPKGPSTDPSVKRLAMMVEDHPYDYRTFEGIIPSGYGAGTVIIWDEGFYEPAKGDFKNKKEQDKYFRAGIHAGKLHFIIKGKKLKGEFALVKTHGRGENSWLLFKVKDEHASTEDITKKDKSVISKKTLEQVEKTTKNFYGSKRIKESSSKSKKEVSLNKRRDVQKASAKNKAEKEGKSTLKAAVSKALKKAVNVSRVKSLKKVVKKAAKKAVKKSGKSASSSQKKNAPETTTDISAILKKAPKGAMPKTITPMLATLVDKPFDEEGWIYEVKWDGYRAVALLNKGKFDLKSRNDKSFATKFYPVSDAFKAWGEDVVLDGEVVVVNENGVSNFGALQNWRSESDGEILFYAFDILWYQGKDLTGLELSQRKEILKAILPVQNEIIRISKAFEESGIEFFEAAKKMNLEGIIAKKKDSPYREGVRNNDWLKIKHNLRQEMVIGGYTLNDDSGKAFSALLVGVYEDGRLN